MQNASVSREILSGASVRGPQRKPAFVPGWRCVLGLDEDRALVSGSELELARAIRDGADLRVGTAFRHDEHIEVGSNCRDLIQEFIDFRVTYLLEGRWAAGICNLRMPVHPPNGFGPRESMSYFLYNQDGLQAVARPYLDGNRNDGKEATLCSETFAQMPRFKEFSRADSNTNAPSFTFVYNFDYFRYCVNQRWHEAFAHEADGTVIHGSLDDLIEAFNSGAEFKVGIRGLCDDLSDSDGPAMDHEVFVHIGSCYYYTDQQLFMGAAQPVVRVAPTIPLVYRSRNWDFGWLLPRTDGQVARWLCDPYTLKFRKSFSRHAIRWFIGS